ncbi:hypothetical protein [Shewanella sp. SR44-3]|uniref:hypothetical protein n=1 Tax=unclassified Shewanella TaxID=196818 RepID=UPI0015F9A838|nr:hypothetical protein [Shewanella sp. SR44-3]MBB1267769.1 hypothetical protein [Shewanella sp. SR44-3]
MLIMGLLGVVIIYGGFLYLLFTGRSTVSLPWYLLLSPWICVYFGLTQTQQLSAMTWIKAKFSR